jgi:hypothetical protein
MPDPLQLPLKISTNLFLKVRKKESKMKWFRFYDEFMDDPKIAMMNDSDQLLWVKALCLANSSSKRGTILLSDTEICWKLRINLEQWQSAIDKFRAKGMIEHQDGGYLISKWGKRQFLSDDVTARTSAHKEKKKTEKERSGNVPRNRKGTSSDTEQNQNTEQIQSKADPERVAVQVCDQKFDLPVQPTATEQKSQLTAKQPQSPPGKNPTQEITSVSRSTPAENDQQTTLTLSRDEILMQQKRAALQGRSSADERSAYVDQAINTYNQYRGAWGECVGLSNSARNSLERMLTVPGRSPDEFISLVRDATLWAAKSEWLNKPDFESKHFGYLIGRSGNQDRLVDYAYQWRSLPDSSKVGAALKIAQQKEQIQYHDLQGNPTIKTWAMGIWWKISKAAKAGESISKLEKDWANFYFPNYDIYVGDEWLA